ncbi:hypothetical protein PoB_002736600 [Plakobranchus ocellatus]|uniref:FLYWCH-type domain-containing protein n=1 Tax=Plakobranchus ocellatus TaxID=259542 RepID=A0AAV3ZY79_9GAST|nr:hypothetical protein PoB_002736600 [Plakobranchus ocellatus]
MKVNFLTSIKKLDLEAAILGFAEKKPVRVTLFRQLNRYVSPEANNTGTRRISASCERRTYVLYSNDAVQILHARAKHTHSAPMRLDVSQLIFLSCVSSVWGKETSRFRMCCSNAGKWPMDVPSGLCDAPGRYSVEKGQRHHEHDRKDAAYAPSASHAEGARAGSGAWLQITGQLPPSR